MKIETDPMTLLSSVAHGDKPRLFTLYGLTRGAEPREILGWGMAFPQEDKTLFYSPYTTETHHANNPDQIRQVFELFADTRVDWLDEG